MHVHAVGIFLYIVTTVWFVESCHGELCHILGHDIQEAPDISMWFVNEFKLQIRKTVTPYTQGSNSNNSDKKKVDDVEVVQFNMIFHSSYFYNQVLHCFQGCTISTVAPCYEEHLPDQTMALTMKNVLI